MSAADVYHRRQLDPIQGVQHLAVAGDVDRSRDGESRFAEILAMLIVGSVLSTAAVALRAFTRMRMLRTFGLDDTVMVVAQSFYASIVLYNIATTVVKLSILLQYRRIFSSDWMQRLTTWGLAFMSAWTIMLCFLLPLMCVPVAAFWDESVEGRCIDLLTSWYVMAGVNLVADFVMFSMPIPVINSLQLPRRQKRMLFFVFGLGFLTCIISVYRLQTLRVAAHTEDPYWDNVDAATWSFLEVTIGILAACLPTLRPIFVTLLPRLFNGSSFHAKSGSGRPSRYGINNNNNNDHNNPYGSRYGHASEGNTMVGIMSALGRHRPPSSTEGLNRQAGGDEVELPGPETERSVEYTVSVSTGASDKLSRATSPRGSEDDEEAVGGISSTKYSSSTLRGSTYFPRGVYSRSYPKAFGPPISSPACVSVHRGEQVMPTTVTRYPYLNSGTPRALPDSLSRTEIRSGTAARTLVLPPSSVCSARMFSFLKGIFTVPPRATAATAAFPVPLTASSPSSSSPASRAAMCTSPYEWPLNSRLSTLTILPRNNTLAASGPPASWMMDSATVLMVLVARQTAMQRPMRHASETVLSTPNRLTRSLVVGFAAMPTREPISEHEARRARSTISSLGALVMTIVLPSPESMAQGTSSRGACTASVVCQYVGYALPIQSPSMMGVSKNRDEPTRKGSRPLAPPISRPMTASKVSWRRYSISALKASTVSVDCRRSMDTAGEPMWPRREPRRRPDDTHLVSFPEHVPQLDLGGRRASSSGAPEDVAAVGQIFQVRLADVPLRNTAGGVSDNRGLIRHRIDLLVILNIPVQVFARLGVVFVLVLALLVCVEGLFKLGVEVDVADGLDEGPDLVADILQRHRLDLGDLDALRDGAGGNGSLDGHLLGLFDSLALRLVGSALHDIYSAAYTCDGRADCVRHVVERRPDELGGPLDALGGQDGASSDEEDRDGIGRRLDDIDGTLQQCLYPR
ncbi:integral membrane protein [Colletotrichum higginsianum]|nr:integral membrane protein [Colletotrichum higginsianum]